MKKTGYLPAGFSPGNARLEGTIRTLSMESMEKIKSRIRSLVRGIWLGVDSPTAFTIPESNPTKTPSPWQST